MKSITQDRNVPDTFLWMYYLTAVAMSIKIVQFDGCRQIEHVLKKENRLQS